MFISNASYIPIQISPLCFNKVARNASSPLLSSSIVLDRLNIIKDYANNMLTSLDALTLHLLMIRLLS